ncbi:Pet127-domain-containing protein [Xylariaceae sp. FL1019]|nr:Pet127-domain-containing protein [Xylariaceae sp. FL1019]
MLRISRSHICRASSYCTCASYQTTPLSFYASPHSKLRRAAGQHHTHHVRRLATDASNTVTAAKGASTAATPQPSLTTTLEPATSSETIPETPKPGKGAKKKKKKKPVKDQASTKPLPKGTERKLLVLEGALEALKNVLTTKGIDVGHSLGDAAPSARPPSGSKPAPVKTFRKPPVKMKAKQAAKKPKAAKQSTEESTSETAETGIEHPSRKPTSKVTGKPLADLQRKSGNKSSAKLISARSMKRTPPSRALSPPTDVPTDPVIPPPKKRVAKRLAVKQPIVERVKERKALPISKLSPMAMALEPMDVDKPPVPPLSYGLDRVLFNSGVYQLQDPHTNVFNFDPYLSNIMPISEFDFNALKQYVTSSKDTNLISIAKDNNKKYTGSTSSMTSMLSHFHYLLSSFRPLEYSMLSRGFRPESDRFTRIMRAPAATFLHWKDGTYAIDADKEFDTANVLSMLGKSMEKLLTLPKDEYEKYRHENSDQITEEERNAEEAFHFTSFGDFMMRSQLDAYDPRVPGSGMFDLKTRAVVSIRMDVQGFEKGLDYEIRHKLGQWESFEREYYDMVRSAFLKYSLQVRMGRMDGIFVAYHNIKRIFGFQYVSLREMDESLHGGSTNLVLGDAEFKASLHLLNELLNRASEKWPEQSLSIVVETRESAKNGITTPFMYFFAKPVSAAYIKEKQEKGKAKIEAYESKILGLVRDAETNSSEKPTESEAVANEDQTPLSPAAEELISVATWDEAREMVQNAMDDDELGIGVVREAIEDALEQSNILPTTSSAEAREYVDALIETLTGHSPAALSETRENDLDEGENDNELEYENTQGEHDDSHKGMDKVHDERENALEADEEENVQHGFDETTKILGGDQVSEEGTNSASNMPAQSVVAPTPDQSNVEMDIATVDETNAVSDVGDTHATRSFATSGSKEEETTEEEARDEVEEEDESEDDFEMNDTKEDATPAGLAPLTDLIVRMAQRIDEHPTGIVGSRHFGDDASRLRIFERTLSRLISGSRSLEAHKEDASRDVDTLQETASEIATAEETQPPATDLADATAESGTPVAPRESPKREMLGMVLTVKNKVNGTYVTRPENLQKEDDWTVEYTIQEIDDPERAYTLYKQSMSRRRATLTFEDKDAEWYNMFRGELAKSTTAGREYRKKKEESDRTSPKYMVDSTQPLPREKTADSAE